MPLQVARSARANYLIDNYVGDKGQIFWDETQGEIRLSNGVTPGGIALTGNIGELDPLFIPNLPGINPVVQADDLFLLYDASTGALKKVTFQQLSASGETGYTGSQGEIGYTGSQGLRGYSGSVGDIGYTGSQGEIGYTGSKGADGYQGVDGYTGSQGEIGYTGSQGELGYTGSQGEIGYTGSQGELGYTGSQGEIGYTGSQGESGVANVASNTGLAFDEGILSTTYNSVISDTVESVAVGGATSAPASVWKNKNIVQVLDTILFPDIYATYTVPTISISGNQSGTKEIGQTISQSLTLTATENDAGIFTQLLIKRGATTLSTDVAPTGIAVANIADQYGYINPNNPNLRYTASYTDIFVVTSGTTSWSGTGSYDAGLAKKNNKGVDDDRPFAVRSTSAPQAASTFNSNAVSVNGIYPYFWGVSSTQPTASTIAAEIAAGNANKVLASATGTVTITFNASAEYIWFAHFTSYTTKTKWYNTELNQGAIGAGNFILTPISQGVDSPDGYWNDVLFSIYISDAATLTEGSIQFRNS